MDQPGLPLPAAPRLSGAGEGQEEMWMEKSPKFAPQTEVQQQVWGEQQVLGEQQLGLGEFPSRAGEGGWSRARLGSSSWEST